MNVENQHENRNIFSNIFMRTNLLVSVLISPELNDSFRPTSIKLTKSAADLSNSLTKPNESLHNAI
jgi:hypothetical protein